MTKKFLFVMLAVALAFGVAVSGCKDSSEEKYKDRTLNMEDSGNNSIILTVKGPTWKDFTEDNLTNKGLQAAFIGSLLKWTPISGNITELNSTYIKIDFSLVSDSQLKIAFSKQTDQVLGQGITGSGKLELKALGTVELMGYLTPYTNGMEGTNLLPDWLIGTNTPVTITIK